MADLYSHVFSDIFKECEPYFIHDFLNVRCTGNGNKKYCLFTYKKIFEEAIKVLDRSKYNGEIVIPEFIVFDSNNIYSTNEIINTSRCFEKGKIVIKDRIIKLANARDTDKKDRIFLFPIDGIYSFSNGNSDFAMVIILLQKKEEKDAFEAKSISIFNPICKDVLVFDDIDGCKYNGKKISFDGIYSDNCIDLVYVNNAIQKTSFDLTKLAKIGNLSISNSIFSALTELLVTNKNLCICKIDEDIFPFIEFATSKSSLILKKIGSHFIIGKEALVKKVTK